MAVSTDLIRKMEIFNALPEVHHQELSRRFELRKFPAGAKIVEQGDSSDHFYVMLSGTVNITRANQEGREVFLNMLGPGDYFGEACLFNEVKRTANVLAQDEVQTLAISRASFLEFYEAQPGPVGRILFYMMRKLFFRLDQMSHELHFRRIGGIDQDAIDKLFS